MTVHYKFQNSFAAGEVSPSTWLRNDLDLHEQAVKTMLNVTSDPHGPAVARSGLEFIEEIVDESYCRIFAFNADFAHGYLVVVTPNVIVILDRNGFQLSNNLVQNPHFGDGSDQWTFDNVLFLPSVALIEPGMGLGNEAWLRQQLISAEPTELHLIQINGIAPYAITAFEIRIGTTPGGVEILQEVGSGSSYETSFTPGVSPFYFEIWIDSGESAKSIDSIVVRYVTPGPPISRVEFLSPYTTQDIVELQVDMVPGKLEMILVTRDVAPKILSLVSDTLWIFDDVVFSFGVGGSPWEGSFPGCITFHDGRMALGGSREEPATIWLSKPNEYFNFDLGDSSNPDDALELPIAKHGDLHWLISNKQLFAGMDTGEHVITSTGVLAPDDAQVRQHSSYGSARIHAVMVEEQTAFVNSSGRTILSMDYVRNVDGWQSHNLTFQASHITEGIVKELNFGFSTVGTIIAPTVRGDLVVANVERDQGTLGWNLHKTDGYILSTVFIREFGVDRVWVAVLRDNKLFIERFSDDIYLDSNHTEESLVLTSSFPGFDHLVGREVQVVLDGTIHPNVVVPVTGIITTDYPGLLCSAGLGYDCILETLPEQNAFKSGSTIGNEKRFSEIYVYLLDSPRPLINGIDPYLRRPATSMGKREVNETGLIGIANAGWNKEATITISQPLPLPMIIGGIGGRLTENKL